MNIQKLKKVDGRKKYIERNKKWKAENPEKVIASNKRYYKKNRDKILKRNNIYNKGGGNLKRYNITLKEYKELLKKQKGVCAICKQSEVSKLKGKIKKLAVDHCHKIGKVRGLLCDRCNRGLGYFRDDKIIIKNALNYLKKYGK